MPAVGISRVSGKSDLGWYMLSGGKDDGERVKGARGTCREALNVRRSGFVSAWKILTHIGSLCVLSRIFF